MNNIEALMSMEDIPEEELRAIAETLRGRMSAGGALSTSTIAPVADQGALMQKEGLARAVGIGDMNYRKAALKEDRRNALIRAMSSGSGDASERGFHKPSGTATTKYEEKAARIGNVAGLLDRWKPEYTSSLPLSGPVEEWMGRTGGIPATQTQEEMAAWWADWKRDYENIVRHDLFGSALTNSEKQEWAKANINSNMSPQMINDRMVTLRRLNELAAARSVRSAINKDWDPTYSLDEYEGVMPEEVRAEGRPGLDRWVRERRSSYSSPSPLQAEGNAQDAENLSDDEVRAMLKERGLL